ncbi:MAG: hypothetical protein O3C10_09380 [Chloroflexi bacterium]|nr:hypothetical protein [Chloroflexota bacterium]
MSNELIIAVEVLTSAYIVGAIASMRADEWTARLPESERQGARVRSGIYWPRRLARWVTAQATSRTRVGA